VRGDKGRAGLARGESPVILNHVVHLLTLDSAFAALADPTRRAVLERLGAGPASVSDLAEPFGITLTGMKKHLRVLEEAQLVTTEKIGRVRMCRLGPRDLGDAATWIDSYRSTLLGRFDRFADVLEREKERRK
jgi:DNA-binding transcriptional ArsR family regulator